MNLMLVLTFAVAFLAATTVIILYLPEIESEIQPILDQIQESPIDRGNFPLDIPKSTPSPVPESSLVKEVPTPTIVPTPTQEPTPTLAPEPGPTSALTPTLTPTPTATPEPTEEPTQEPGQTPTPELKVGEWPSPSPIGGYPAYSIAKFRSDLVKAEEAGSFYQDITPINPSNNAEGNQHTSGSFILHIEHCNWDFPFLSEASQSCGLVQAGVLTTNSEVRWFVHSFLPLECLRGTEAWPTPSSDSGFDNKSWGCLGEPGDLVGLNQPTRVRITRQGDDSWRVYVREEPVAKIQSESSEIHFAASVFVGPRDDDLEGGFWFSVPRWMDNDSNWEVWPTSGSVHNQRHDDENTARSMGPCKEVYGLIDAAGVEGGQFYLGNTSFYRNSINWYSFVCQSRPLF
jgi:hypothetical protein